MTLRCLEYNLGVAEAFSYLYIGKYFGQDLGANYFSGPLICFVSRDSFTDILNLNSVCSFTSCSVFMGLLTGRLVKVNQAQLACCVQLGNGSSASHCVIKEAAIKRRIAEP